MNKNEFIINQLAPTIPVKNGEIFPFNHDAIETVFMNFMYVSHIVLTSFFARYRCDNLVPN